MRTVPGAASQPAGANVLTQEELAGIRKQLEQEVDRLHHKIVEAARDFGSNVGEFINGDGDEVVDVGTLMIEVSEGSSLANNETIILRQCERALERINASAYGVCEACQKTIAKERLLAIPRATHCVSCQQNH